LWRGNANLNFPDDSKFEGEWHNNLIDGYGRFTTQEGKQVFGNWKQGQMIYTLPENYPNNMHKTPIYALVPLDKIVPTPEEYEEESDDEQFRCC